MVKTIEILSKEFSAAVGIPLFRKPTAQPVSAAAWSPDQRLTSCFLHLRCTPPTASEMLLYQAFIGVLREFF